MKITLLGTGGAAGVPMISQGWGLCDPQESKNRRLRSSILVENQDTAILVDTSPDLREQLLNANIRHLDGLIYTHGHADHTHGIDDIREVNRLMRNKIPTYGLPETLDDLKRRFAYAFEGYDYDIQDTNKMIFKPWLDPNPLLLKDIQQFSVAGQNITAIMQDHGWSRSLGFRFGDFAYSTDLISMEETGFEALTGLKVWVVGCVMRKAHTTHANLETVLSWVERLRPERTIITHMGIGMDYASLKSELPNGVEPGYDGMVVTL